MLFGTFTAAQLSGAALSYGTANAGGDLLVDLELFVVQAHVQPICVFCCCFMLLHTVTG